VENGRILLEDWPDPPSKAGLLVRGKRVPSARLVSGETVTLGRSTLVFHLGARPRVRRLPAVREWRLPVAFLAAGLAGAAAVRSVAAGRAAAVEPDRLVLAWSARDAGELRQAVQLLEEPAALAVRTPEAETLVRDCRRNERQFETPRRLEESLRLDEARDAWARLALGMPEGDPLRAWVETACVARISRRLAEMRP